jgi:hypothetical protein
MDEKGGDMTRFTGYFVAVALLAAPAAVFAQDFSPAQVDRPRVEVGAGGSWMFNGGSWSYNAGMIDTRVGVKLSRNWSVEGLVHVMPGSRSDINGFYRAQVLWRIGKGSVQPFVAFGGAGEFARSSWPEYRYDDYYTGEPRVIPAGSDFNITAPWYPTATIGVEKVLASRLILRAELTTAYAVSDYGVVVSYVPAVSVSIPLGRYRTSAR